MREQDNHDNPKWKLMDKSPNNKPAIKDTEHNSGESPTQLANLESKEKNYKRRRIRKNKELTITTINVRGIKGKIKSLESLLQAEKIDIALITETKMRKGHQISIKGYRWIEKQRTDNKGGGVGILVSEKIANNTTENNNLDDHELLESKWIRIECRPRNIAVGVFYGPQENEKVEKVKEIYNALSHQLHQIQDECDIILAGDFNAKLKISKENCEQAESRNGKILQEMITENNLTPATINADHGIWTRANRKITRRSENDDTPQPLDQWTHSPFMGQQVGNWSICHALWPKRKPIVHPTLYPTHISFIPSQSTFPFLNYGY